MCFECDAGFCARKTDCRLAAGNYCVQLVDSLVSSHDPPTARHADMRSVPFWFAAVAAGSANASRATSIAAVEMLTAERTIAVVRFITSFSL